MTSPTSAATSPPGDTAAGSRHGAAHAGPPGLGARRRAGFTLIELLVVIGIMTLLVAILMPMVMKAYAKATSAKMAADLAAIGSALEAYRQDHFAYPLVRTNPSIGTVAQPATGALMPDRPNPPTG